MLSVLLHSDLMFFSGQWLCQTYLICSSFPWSLSQVTVSSRWTEAGWILLPPKAGAGLPSPPSRFRISPVHSVLLIILLSSLSSLLVTAASMAELSTAENIFKMCPLLFFTISKLLFFFLIYLIYSFLLSDFNFGKQHIKLPSVPLLCHSLPPSSLSCLCLFISCLN